MAKTIEARYLTMPEAVQESGVSRFTLTPAMQRGELHGVQRVPRGKWHIREDCLRAWMAAEQCEHQKAAAA